VFDLVDTIYPETITFKILSTFDGGRTHVSPLVTTIKTCNNNYPITEVAAVASPQYVAHLQSLIGFAIPSYTDTQQTGCPTSTFEVSSTDSPTYTAHPTLNQIQTIGGIE